MEISCNEMAQYFWCEHQENTSVMNKILFFLQLQISKWQHDKVIHDLFQQYINLSLIMRKPATCI